MSRYGDSGEIDMLGTHIYLYNWKDKTCYSNL
jgi:hypothetical protein